MNFEIYEVSGGYILEWHSQNTAHRGDNWHETLESALEQAKLLFGIEPEKWQSVGNDLNYDSIDLDSEPRS